MTEQSIYSEGSPLLASLPAPSSGKSSVPTGLADYDLFTRGPQLLKKISYLMMFLAALVFCMNSWAAALADSTISYTNEKKFSIFSMVHSVSLVIFSALSCIISFLCQTDRADTLFMTSISGLVLAAYGFIASAFSWAWYESVEAALPSRSVIGFVAFAQIAATLAQILWVYVGFRHSKAMTQPNAPEAVKSFPAYLTRGLSMVMLLVFVAVFMTVGYSNRAETIVWVIFALFHVAAAMYISFKGGSRFWILISTFCMSIVLIYSIVTVGLASQHLPNSSSASPGTSSSSSSSMHGVSALVHCVSISFFAFAGFIWNCTMWYYLRVHADATDISEQDIDDSTETFGSSFFPAKPLLFISGAILFVAVLQIILGGLAANHIGAVGWGSGVSMLSWGGMAMFFVLSQKKNEFLCLSIIISGSIIEVVVFWCAVVAAGQASVFPDAIAASVVTLLNTLLLPMWIILNIIWFYHSRSDKTAEVPIIVLPVVSAQMAFYALLFFIFSCLPLPSITKIGVNPAGVIYGLFCAGLYLAISVYANVCVWKGLQPRFFRMGVYMALLVGFLYFIGAGMSSRFFNLNSNIPEQETYFRMRIILFDVTLLSLLLTWVNFAWKAGKDEPDRPRRINDEETPTFVTGTLPGVESAPVDPDEQVTI